MALQSLQKAALRDLNKAACDWRANFRVMRGNVGTHETTPPFACRFVFRTKQRSRFSHSGRRKRERGLHSQCVSS
jgi:hypothetical protein